MAKVPNYLHIILKHKRQFRTTFLSNFHCTVHISMQTACPTLYILPTLRKKNLITR